ncbi:MAG: hypothetical protein MUE82_04070 [Chloroflexi bacterium]|jgi:hypothetical protein|nr:hypothetical protein [Chloroflexota bacterium]
MDALVEALRAEGLDPGSWSNDPGDVYAPHLHAYDKVLVVARGSIDFGLPDLARSAALGTGDRLDLPAGTRHDARVGPDGVTCLEAHLPAGSLRLEPTLLPAGSWGSSGAGGGAPAGSPRTRAADAAPSETDGA